MQIIHVQEVNSDQVVEVIAPDANTAIQAYARRCAFDWNDLLNSFVFYHDHIAINGVEKAVYYFKTEKLTIRCVYGNRYIAMWEDV